MRWLRCAVLSLLSSVLLAPQARAADGEILINHAKALAGNVTPGDGPGYPVTLTLPGAYRLSGSLTAPAGIDAIAAAAVEISIDLNGFRIEGSGVARYGINGTQRNLTVRNGTVQRFQVGIVAGGGAAILEDLRITENGNFGILAAQAYASIRNTTVILTRGGTGISCDAFACLLDGNTVALNQTGVAIKTGSLVNNAIVGNTLAGISLATGAAVGFGGNTLHNNGIQVQGTGLMPAISVICQPAC